MSKTGESADSMRLSGDQKLPAHARDDLQNQDTEHTESIENSVPIGNRSVLSCSPHGRTDPEHVPNCEHKDRIDTLKETSKSFFVRKCQSLALSRSKHTQ